MADWARPSLVLVRRLADWPGLALVLVGRLAGWAGLSTAGRARLYYTLLQSTRSHIVGSSENNQICRQSEAVVR